MPALLLPVAWSGLAAVLACGGSPGTVLLAGLSGVAFLIHAAPRPR